MCVRWRRVRGIVCVRWRRVRGIWIVCVRWRRVNYYSCELGMVIILTINSCSLLQLLLHLEAHGHLVRPTLAPRVLTIPLVDPPPQTAPRDNRRLPQTPN